MPTLRCLAACLFASCVAFAQEPAAPPGDIKAYHFLKTVPLEIEDAGIRFGDAMRKTLAQDSPENITQMKVALADVLLALNRLKPACKALKLGPSSAATELFDAAEAYMKRQEATIAGTGPELMRIAFDSALSLSDKNAQIVGIIERNRKSAVELESRYARAMSAYARELGIIELRTFVADDRSCKVQMPELTESKIGETGGIKNTYYIAEDKTGVFMLSYADVGPAGDDGAALQKRLEDGRAGMIKRLQLKVNRETPIMLGERFPGRELEGDLPDGKTSTRIRLYIVNGRLYQLWVVGPTPFVSSPEASRFLTSLEVLNN